MHLAHRGIGRVPLLAGGVVRVECLPTDFDLVDAAFVHLRRAGRAPARVYASPYAVHCRGGECVVALCLYRRDGGRDWLLLRGGALVGCSPAESAAPAVQEWVRAVEGALDRCQRCPDPTAPPQPPSPPLGSDDSCPRRPRTDAPNSQDDGAYRAIMGVAAET